MSLGTLYLVNLEKKQVISHFENIAELKEFFEQRGGLLKNETVLTKDGLINAGINI